MAESRTLVDMLYGDNPAFNGVQFIMNIPCATEPSAVFFGLVNGNATTQNETKNECEKEDLGPHNASRTYRNLAASPLALDTDPG